VTQYGRPVRTVVVVVLAVAVIALVYIVNSGSADDEDTTTEATVAPDTGKISLDPDTGEISAGAETAGDGPAIDRKRCGKYGRWRLVVYGQIPCSLARHVMRGYAHDRVPAPRAAKDRTTASLICPGRHVECGAIVARFSDTS
jgi:hypothetical protein